MTFTLAIIVKTGQKFWILPHLSESVDVPAWCFSLKYALIRSSAKVPRVHRCLHWGARECVWQGGMHGRGVYMAGGVHGTGACMAGGHARQGGMCGRGLCMAGGGHPWQGVCGMGACVVGVCVWQGACPPLADTKAMAYSQ